MTFFTLFVTLFILYISQFFLIYILIIYKNYYKYIIIYMIRSFKSEPKGEFGRKKVFHTEKL